MDNRTVKVILAGMAGALLFGCSSGGSSGNGSGHGPGAKQPAFAKDLPLAQAELPKKVDNDPKIRKNVTQTSCDAVPGGWSAGGTAKNPGQSPVTYAITVYFTTTKATVLDFATTKVRVDPGKSADWKATKQFPFRGKLLCPMPGIATADE